MSHISKVSTMVKNLDSLAAACAKLGVELIRGKKKYRTYNGALNDCEHAIVIPGPDAPRGSYQLGLVRASWCNETKKPVPNPAGDGWLICYDSWNGGQGMMSRVGNGCGLLLQEYGLAVTRAKAAALGHTVRETRLEDGSVRLVCEPKQKLAKQW